MEETLGLQHRHQTDLEPTCSDSNAQLIEEPPLPDSNATPTNQTFLLSRLEPLLLLGTGVKQTHYNTEIHFSPHPSRRVSTKQRILLSRNHTINPGIIRS